jgi:hypothetical protein
MAITLDGTTGIDQSNVIGASTMPSGTTAERPVSPVNGMQRFNTTTGYMEYYTVQLGSKLPLHIKLNFLLLLAVAVVEQTLAVAAVLADI